MPPGKGRDGTHPSSTAKTGPAGLEVMCTMAANAAGSIPEPALLNTSMVVDELLLLLLNCIGTRAIARRQHGESLHFRRWL
jgi:hypothetical protein